MDFSITGLPHVVALASIALLGYMLGRRRSRGTIQEQQSQREIARAQAVAQQLDRISTSVRSELARHESNVKRFKDRIRRLSNNSESISSSELCSEAERILQPTMELLTHISSAYDALQLQTNHLRTFAEARTDPLTGLCNRRALEEALSGEFARRNRYSEYFSIAIIDIDQFKKINDTQGHLMGDRIIKSVAEELDREARESDIVARFGGEEFVIVMPQTDLAGAAISAERLRKKIAANCSHLAPVTVSMGIATVNDDDDAEGLMTRADEALYQAKNDGRNCVRRHTGESIERLEDTTEPAAELHEAELAG